MQSLHLLFGKNMPKYLDAGIEILICCTHTSYPALPCGTCVEKSVWETFFGGFLLYRRLAIYGFGTHAGRDFLQKFIF